MSAQRVEETWQLKAACRGPHAAVFFPPSQFERKEEKLDAILHRLDPAAAQRIIDELDRKYPRR